MRRRPASSIVRRPMSDGPSPRAGHEGPSRRHPLELDALDGREGLAEQARGSPEDLLRPPTIAGPPGEATLPQS